MIWLFWTAAVLFILNFEGSALTTKHRHEHRTSSGLAMTENPEKSELDDALFAVWRQVLVEGKKRNVTHISQDRAKKMADAKAKETPAS